MSTALPDPPADVITQTALCQTSSKNLLLVSSWDKSLYLYDLDSRTLASKIEQASPILDCSVAPDGNKAVFGTLDGNVYQLDITTSDATKIGSHRDAVRCVTCRKEGGLYYSGGWDRCLSVWDPRMQPLDPACSVFVHGKVFAMDACKEKLVICDSSRRTYIYQAAKPELSSNDCEYRDSLLQYQSRSLRCFPNGEGFAMSSVEGRVVWEYFDQDPQRKAKSYAFKCHRNKKSDGTEIVYPVHALAFHQQYGTFATGGADGSISIWDGIAKKRLNRVPNQQSCISSLAFCVPKSTLVVAVSSALENPEAAEGTNQLLLIPYNDADVLPKTE